MAWRHTSSEDAQARRRGHWPATLEHRSRPPPRRHDLVEAVLTSGAQRVFQLVVVTRPATSSRVARRPIVRAEILNKYPVR